MLKSFRFFWVATILCAGCAKRAAMYQKATGLSEGESGLASLEYNVLLRSSGAGGGRGTVFAAPRFVAVRHKLEIVEPSSGLTKSIEAVVAFCGTLQCEVLSSSITNETAVLSQSGNIAARVAPPDLNKFLDFVGKQGKIAQHASESEDKTIPADKYLQYPVEGWELQQSNPPSKLVPAKQTTLSHSVCPRIIRFKLIL